MPAKRTTSPSFSDAQSAGSAKTSGTMPKFTRLALWIRANPFTSFTRTPRKRGAMAACSRLEPCP